MKNVIKFISFLSKFKLIYKSIPSLSAYENRLIHNIGSEVKLKGSSSEIKEILPLKSLVFTDALNSIKIMYVKFNREEFNLVMKNKVNEPMIEFGGLFFKLPIVERYNFYCDNQESLSLLTDVFINEYHLNDSSDVVTLINFLIDELDNDTITVSKDAIKQRLDIEMEFIKRRKETQQFEMK